MSEETNEYSKFKLNKKFDHTEKKSFWIEIGTLIRENNAINLGAGFPDYQSLTYLDQIIQETKNECNSLIHQYTRSTGHLRLVNAIAKLYGKYFKREIDPLNQVIVSVGAAGSLFYWLTGFLDKDDEIIIIEPFFDCYTSLSMSAGAKCAFVPLRPKSKIFDKFLSSGDWVWDENELEAAFNPKTKFIIINSPNNPLGKIFTEQELKKVADLCIKYNVICIADEVYEHICFDRPLIRMGMANIPGMWERTISIYSAGKAFSITGVKIGWSIGPKELIQLCQVVHINSIYSCATFFQEVVARCIELELTRLDSPHCYFNSILNELRPKRDKLANALLEAGLTPTIPEGGYFVMADITNLANDFQTDEFEHKDKKFVKYLIKKKGLGSIPCTGFYYKNKHIGENYIRLCFFKNDETLEKVFEMLKNFAL